MATILERYKVNHFRSIEESDWIELADNNCLVGTNEAGKTNLLIALWKLRPANDEPIIPLDDFPRHLFSRYETDGHSKDVFITADFILDEGLQDELSAELNCDKEQIRKVLVERKYDGKYYITFPYSKINEFDASRAIELLSKFEEVLKAVDSFQKEDENLQKSILEFILSKKEEFEKIESFRKDDIIKLIDDTQKFQTDNFGRKKNLPEIFKEHLIRQLDFFIKAFDGKPIETTSEIHQKVLKNLPKFVYYSDYGNLDSEIFLPRVIEDFERTDLTESARAKARTLKVLFKYVGLSPEEIYELGNDRKIIIKKMDNYGREISSEEQDLSDEEIQEWADKKRKRGILLTSAATELTKSFKNWWLQGDYIFAFSADGHHFRINVSDSLRPEPIELEGRSRGLQWFFSFFLVFLVETKEAHSNTILLLDEPGLSLHPIAQYDLAKFFRKLSIDNQLIYTSHSPFLVDMENLANVKAVYVDKKSGRTKVSSNLRYDEVDAEKSIYPVHAALGLTVSDTLLLGCLPVLVEGVSDQIYLNLIKRFLIGNGKLKYSKEFVFIPTGGVRGMGPVSKLVSSRDDELPFVLVDSDKTGKEYKKQLTKGRYKDAKEKVLEVADFHGNQDFEIEDLIPREAMVRTIDRMFRGDQFFEDVFDAKKPIVDQIEEWAKNNSIILQVGWKVDLSRNIQNRFEILFGNADNTLIEAWEKLFQKMLE